MGLIRAGRKGRLVGDDKDHRLATRLASLDIPRAANLGPETSERGSDSVMRDRFGFVRVLSDAGPSLEQR